MPSLSCPTGRPARCVATALPQLATLATVLIAHAALAAWLLSYSAAETVEPSLPPLRMDVRLIERPAAPARPLVEQSQAVAATTPKRPVPQRPPQPRRRAPVAQQAVKPAVQPALEPPTAPAPAITDLAARQATPAPVPAAPAATPAVFVEARFDADYLRNPAPVYPPISRRRGEQGVVLLAVAVSANGVPESVEIRQGSGYARLDEAALRAVEGWRFVPARRGEQAVPAQVVVPIEFRLQG